jgi:oxygen-dependent protoporphyrinogen oxidase
MGHEITVIGAGFSGLVTAFYLVQEKMQVRIIEKSERAGGLIQTLNTTNGLVETAANGILSSPDVVAMCSRIGVPLKPTLPQSRARYIYRGGPRRWPLRFTESIRLAAGLAWNVGRFRPEPRESVSEWGSRVLGKAATEHLLAPALAGVYAGDAQKLSATLVLRRGDYGGGEAGHKLAAKPRTVAPAGGLQQLIDGLALFLAKAGVEIVMGKRAEIRDRERVIICTSALEASQVLKGVAPDISRQLERIEMLPLVTATCFYDRSPEQIRGFGCLFPRGQGFRSLGVLFNDCIFEGRSPIRSETWILGGALDPRIIDLDDSALRALLENEHERLTGLREKLIEAKITRWPNALPHYTTELELILNHLAVLPPEISLVGNYLGEIGLARIVSRAKRIARRIAHS